MSDGNFYDVEYNVMTETWDAYCLESMKKCRTEVEAKLWCLKQIDERLLEVDCFLWEHGSNELQTKYLEL